MRKTLLYLAACILAIGGIMGIIKGLVPDTDWLSFRYLLHGDGTYTLNETPLFVSVYGVVLATMEIISAVFLFMWKKRLFLFCIITIAVSMLGCFIAVVLGDFFAILSLLIRGIPLYLLIKEYRIH